MKKLKYIAVVLFFYLFILFLPQQKQVRFPWEGSLIPLFLSHADNFSHYTNSNQPAYAFLEISLIYAF